MALTRTSVQLSSEQIQYLSDWPATSISEALRVVIGRYEFLAGEVDVSKLAERYRKPLAEALKGRGFGDFEVIARNLPALLPAVPADLRQWVEKASPLERIALADAVIRDSGSKRAKKR